VEWVTPGFLKKLPTCCDRDLPATHLLSVLGTPRETPALTFLRFFGQTPASEMHTQPTSTVYLVEHTAHVYP